MNVININFPHHSADVGPFGCSLRRFLRVSVFFFKFRCLGCFLWIVSYRSAPLRFVRLVVLLVSSFVDFLLLLSPFSLLTSVSSSECRSFSPLCRLAARTQFVSSLRNPSCAAVVVSLEIEEIVACITRSLVVRVFRSRTLPSSSWFKTLFVEFP